MQDESAASAKDEDFTVVPVSAPRSGRRRWPSVVAATAGVALVAGTAFAAGWMVRPADEDDATAPNPGGTSAGQEIAQPSAGRDGTAAGTSELAASDSRWGGWSGGRTSFHASGLSDESTSAHAWAFDGSAWASAEGVQRIAAAFGVTGEAHEDSGTWYVGPNDGTGPTVSIGAGSPVWFSYYNPANDPWCTTDGSAADPSTGGTPCTPLTGPVPTPDAAISALRDAVSAIGVDPESLSYSATDPALDSGANASWVSASVLVDGKASDVQWSATVTSAGFQSVNGSLGTLVDLGEYPVISPKAAVDRLNDVRFGSLNTIYPSDDGGAVKPLLMTEDSTAAAPALPTTPSPGARIAWAVSDATITHAELGLASTYTDDGAAMLVPVWRLTDDSGVIWIVLAVADSQLDFSTK